MNVNTTPHPRITQLRTLLTFLALILLAGFGSANLNAQSVHHPYPPSLWQMKMDVDGDGKGDLVFIWNNGGIATTRTRLSTGSGYSAATHGNLGIAFGTLGGDREWIPMDVNGDGKTDLVLIWKNGSTADAKTFLSTGSGFSLASNSTIAGSFGALGVSRAYFKADVDGDGLEDLIMIWSNAGQAYARTIVSTGSGFGASTDSDMGRTFGTLGVDRQWIPMDVDGDERTDMVLIWKNGANANASTRLSTGSGFAATGSNIYVAGFGTLGVNRQYLAGDVDGDGRDDLIMIWSNTGVGSARTYLSTGTAFASAGDSTIIATFGTLGLDRHYIPMDADGDGKTDLALIWNNGGAATARTSLSTGSGFGGNTESDLGIGYGTLGQDRLWLKADASGDGKDDLVLVWNNGGAADAKMCLSTGSGFSVTSDTNIAGTFGAPGVDRLYFPPALAPEPPPASVEPGGIYWTNANAVRTAEIDGSNPRTVIPNAARPIGIAIDDGAGQLYWAEHDSGKIRRANLDGTLATDILTGLILPQFLALDEENGRLYWAEWGSGLYSCLLDGSDVRHVIPMSSSGQSTGVALDVPGNAVYLGTASGELYRYGFEEPYPSYSGFVAYLDAGVGTYGIALDADAGNLYVNSFSQGFGFSKNLTTFTEETVYTGLESALGMSFSPDRGQLAWVERTGTATNGRIRLADLGSTTYQTIVTGENSPFGIVFNNAASAGNTFASWIAGFELVEGESGLGDDPDGDGISNLLEYALGQHPVQADRSALPAVQTVDVAGQLYLMLELATDEGASDVELVVEVSGDLVSWTSGARHTVVLEETPTLLRVRDAISMDAGNRRFLRIRASQL